MISWAPTREPLIVGDAEQDESYLEDGHEHLVESLNAFKPLVLVQALGDDKSLGEFDIALKN